MRRGWTLVWKEEFNKTEGWGGVTNERVKTDTEWMQSEDMIWMSLIKSPTQDTKIRDKSNRTGKATSKYMPLGRL